MRYRRRGYTMARLIEGDIVCKQSGMELLVKRDRIKKPGRYADSKPQYYWEGTFLRLETGEMYRARLGNAVIIDAIMWTPRGT